MIRNELKQLIEKSIGGEVRLERPANPEHGDFSTNAALKEKLNPQKITDSLSKKKIFEKVEVAGPGFINFWLSQERLQGELKEILKKKENYSRLEIGKNKKIQVEFISANPTGPLMVHNARGGPYGDALANVLKKAGFQTAKAYYINDAGQQILALGHSVIGDKEAVYKGEYIEKLKKQVKGSDPERAGSQAASRILTDIKKTVAKLGIDYNEWISEAKLHGSDRVDRALTRLEKKNLIYNKDGARWFKSKQFGDTRDRVLVKKDGQKTYLAGDIGLHDYKFEKFDKVINVWGADHHGDAAGLLGAVDGLGHKGKLEILLHQFVTVLDRGKTKRMSKRAGAYVLLDDLLKAAGPDAVRFFFLQKSLDTHLNFDLALARERSSKNPVYYVQYAHARISSVLKKAKMPIGNKFALLTDVHELALIRQLIKWPEIIEDTAADYQVQRLPHYALTLANSFHKFYEHCRVLNEKKELTQARLGLLKAVQHVLQDVLKTMGIDAPEKM